MTRRAPLPLAHLSEPDRLGRSTGKRPIGEPDYPEAQAAKRCNVLASKNQRLAPRVRIVPYSPSSSPSDSPLQGPITPDSAPVLEAWDDSPSEMQAGRPSAIPTGSPACDMDCASGPVSHLNHDMTQAASRSFTVADAILPPLLTEEDTHHDSNALPPLPPPPPSSPPSCTPTAVEGRAVASHALPPWGTKSSSSLTAAAQNSGGAAVPSQGIALPSYSMGSHPWGTASPPLDTSHPSWGTTWGVGSTPRGIASPSLGPALPSWGAGHPSWGLGSPPWGTASPSMGTQPLASPRPDSLVAGMTFDALPLAHQNFILRAATHCWRDQYAEVQIDNSQLREKITHAQERCNEMEDQVQLWEQQLSMERAGMPGAS